MDPFLLENSLTPRALSVPAEMLAYGDTDPFTCHQSLSRPAASKTAIGNGMRKREGRERVEGGDIGHATLMFCRMKGTAETDPEPDKGSTRMKYESIRVNTSQRLERESPTGNNKQETGFTIYVQTNLSSISHLDYPGKLTPGKIGMLLWSVISSAGW